MQSETVDNSGSFNAPARKLEGKYLTFLLNNEHYAIEMTKIEEIIGVTNITRVPKSSPSVRGVINLRGKIIPIVDLRVKLSLPEKANTLKTCFVVIRGLVSGDTLLAGVVVDQVEEVVSLQDTDIKATAPGAPGADRALRGMGRCGDSVYLLLDIDTVFEDVVKSRGK